MKWSASVSLYAFHRLNFTLDPLVQGKGTDQNRLTYLLRPNVTRPDRCARAALETPPVTDLDYSSNPDTDIDSDMISEGDLGSDIEPDHKRALPAIAESPSLPAVSEDNWLMVAEDEEVQDDFESGSENLESSVDVLQSRLEKLSVESANIQPPLTAPGKVQGAGPLGVNVGKLPDVRPYPLQSNSPRHRGWVSPRSSSSPSRSPIRVRRRRRARLNKRVAVSLPTSRSFYDYLFR